MRNPLMTALLGSATLISVLLGAAAPHTPKLPRTVAFNRDIRPILSDNCFACHGPDSANRKASLRLDKHEDLIASRKGGAPVVPGKPDASQLWKRIITTDEEDLMPPPESHKKLSDAEKQLFKKWIEQGAEWEPHWSLVAPQKPAPPKPADASWIRNPIDQFILAALTEQNLTPAPQADRRTLIRRVSFDLIGLPPTAQEVEDFVADKAPDAYEKIVDRLLARSEYGEHRARYWLDAARYGDTHGIHIDNYREMWPYRDWVISAFNRNEPFNQFTLEQIAGDLLSNPTLEQRIATGFHRCNITTNEGGVIPDEAQSWYDKDRVETTGAVWLGLTLGCGACHDHKFDSFTQKEFYQMAAFFRNTLQKPLDGNIADTPPIVTVPSAQDRPRWDELSKQQSQLVARRNDRRKEAMKDFNLWVIGQEPRKLTEPIDPKDEELSIGLDEGKGRTLHAKLRGKPLAIELDDDEPQQPADAKEKPAAGAPGEMNDLSYLRWGRGSGKDKSDMALHFEDKGGVEIAGAGDFEADQPFSVGGWVLPPRAEGSFVVAAKLETGKAAKPQGWVLELAGRILTFRIIGSGRGETLNIRVNRAMELKPGQWSHIFATYDGKRGADGLALYVNGKVLYSQTDDQKLIKGSIRNTGNLRLGSDGKRGLAGGAMQDFRIYKRDLVEEEIAVLAKWNDLSDKLAKPELKIGDSERDRLASLYLTRLDDPYRKLVQDLAKIEDGQREIRRRSPVTHVMQEIPDSKPTAHILNRGQYDQPREEVSADTPKALPPIPAGAPHNRLGLAKWLIDDSNPLTARVTVNRYWQEIFGTGLVKTSEDFGIMGQNPSHPELLDWLAVEFRDSGWDVKKFLRMLVTSATYRQSALATPDKLQADPNNRLLSRGPRFRMDAEALRDFALASSGLLVKKIGGPSVKPYQPEGVWEAVAMNSSNTKSYTPDTGEGLYRRSMYTFWKRSAPPASMDIFNAPTRENCIVRRERTNTPLQALATMNDPQWIEAARHLAQQALKAGQDDNARLDFVTLRVLARPYDPAERQIALATLKELTDHYRSQADAAAKLIRTGESKPDESLPIDESAAWTMLVNQVMNLDEALCK